MSLRDQLIAAFTNAGFKQVPSRSKKKVVFASMRPGYYYYIGSKGSLRKGPTIANSIPFDTTIWLQTLINHRDNYLRIWRSLCKVGKPV